MDRTASYGHQFCLAFISSAIFWRGLDWKMTWRMWLNGMKAACPRELLGALGETDELNDRKQWASMALERCALELQHLLIMHFHHESSECRPQHLGTNTSSSWMPHGPGLLHSV